jgi:hypothetical protein
MKVLALVVVSAAAILGAGYLARAGCCDAADQASRAACPTMRGPMAPASVTPATQPAAASQPAHVTYTCPMHPEVVSDKPGTCPKCGMQLVPRNDGGGAAGHDEAR